MSIPGPKPWIKVTNADIAAVLPFGNQGMTIPEIVAELEARDPGILWGKLGAEYHVRYKINQMAKAGMVRQLGSNGRWRIWSALA